MSKREIIVRELDRLPERGLDRLLAFLRSLKEAALGQCGTGIGSGVCAGEGLAHP
jgi:hypothetical protein